MVSGRIHTESGFAAFTAAMWVCHIMANVVNLKQFFRAGLYSCEL